MKSLFCTNSTIGYGSGGGIVTYHIRKALMEMPSEVKWFDGESEENVICDGLDGKLDLAVFYGAPFGHVAERVQPAKIVSDVAPHSIELSREEHYRLGLHFPYPHLNDYNLWHRYMKHVILADLVIVHSQLSREYLREKLKLENHVEVIPHGCDLPEKTGSYPEEFTVGHLGVNGADKGQIYLTEALKRLRFNIKVVLAGAGTERIGGAGYIKDSNYVYLKSSVYVQPTVTEGFGIPVFEAMAHARPVIVTEGAGSSEWIENGEDGFVVPIRNLEAIAEKIMYFYDNPSEVKRMGKNAREKAKNFTWQKIRKEYIKLFKEVHEI